MVKISRVFGAVAAVGAIALLGPAPLALAQGGVHTATTAGDLDCSDFTWQEDAQAVLDANPSDPNNLDNDHDGIACESLPHKPKQTGTTPGTTTRTTTNRPSASTSPSHGKTTTGQVKVKPVGGVNTGGGDAGPGGGTGTGAAVALGGVALAGTAAGTVLVVRRRARR